jgi:hypothetical protein
MALNFYTPVHHHDPNLTIGGGNCIKLFDRIMFLFRIRISLKVTPRIFSKSKDIWLWTFTRWFTIMTPTYRQEEVTWSIWQNNAPFQLRIYIEVCILPQIFWNLALKQVEIIYPSLEHNRTLSKAYKCNMDLKKKFDLLLNQKCWWVFY